MDVQAGEMSTGEKIVVTSDVMDQGKPTPKRITTLPPGASLTWTPDSPTVSVNPLPDGFSAEILSDDIGDYVVTVRAEGFKDKAGNPLTLPEDRVIGKVTASDPGALNTHVGVPIPE